MEEPLSYMSSDRNVKFMRTLGIYPAEPNSSRTHRLCHTTYRRITLFFVLLYITQQILKIFHVRHYTDQVTATMFLLLSVTDYAYKIVVLAKRSSEIENIFTVMKGPLFNQNEPEHREILLETKQAALKFVRFYNAMAFFATLLWSLQPTLEHFQGKSVKLTIWFPFDINSQTNLYFYLAMIYSFIQTSWQGLGNTTIDAFISYVLDQCRAQLAIVRFNLENIVRKIKNEIERTDNFSDVYEKRFKEILIHYNVIITITDKIQDIFGFVLFYQFLIGGWILCTSAYRLVIVSPMSLEFIYMALYMCCILTQLFLYCFYGNKVTVESEKLSTSAYELDWLTLPMKQRRTLIIFMERIKRPIIKPMAGFIIQLSNSTFLSILRSAYSFYTFLANSDKNLH